MFRRLQDRNLMRVDVFKVTSKDADNNCGVLASEQCVNSLQLRYREKSTSGEDTSYDSDASLNNEAAVKLCEGDKV